MIIIEKDAEIKLLNELTQLRDDAQGYRFIHYSFSELEAEEKSLIQELLTTKMIAEVLENPTAKTFILGDSDVVIIGNDIFTRTFDKLTIEIYKISQVKEIREFSQLYDVSNSWPKLYNLAKVKYAPIAARKDEASKAKQDREELLKKKAILEARDVDPEMVKTLNERRNRRADVNILLVEDDAFSRKLIRNVLNKEYNVIDVEDGKDAVSSYVMSSPDIVFLDIDLPDVSGHDLLQLFLKVDPQAHIIMLSGNCDQENVVKAVQAGAKGFVAKPFLKDRLYKYIGECPSINSKNTAEA